ncbi:hypothetical protein [Mycobacterium shimoidei]|uniref:hypothetical protein n=1 Tax=Mycobacterium shimoidei TaxID=29313 RepID=UPI0009F1D41E|nr:hypothetical protein [Mycobacterium shimoidei]
MVSSRISLGSTPLTQLAGVLLGRVPRGMTGGLESHLDVCDVDVDGVDMRIGGQETRRLAVGDRVRIDAIMKIEPTYTAQAVHYLDEQS